MNMFDEARSVKGMIEMCKMTQEQMASKLGVSQSYVANKLRLLKLDGGLEGMILEAGLTERHARALLKLDGDELRRKALERIIERKLNVAESEALIDLLHDGQAPKRIGMASKLSYIDSFLDNLKCSVATLTSLGVSATQSVSYYGSKTYVTVAIDEE